MDVQNEEPTPLLSDLKDDTSPPKKRVKHVSDFDSSEQNRVFDFDLGLPKHKTRLAKQWHTMFDFLCHKPERSEVFMDLVSKCEKEIAALENASKKAGSFIKEVKEGLKKDRRRRRHYARMVIETITSGQKVVLKEICEAREMLIFVRKDVDTYRESVDNLILNYSNAGDLYSEKTQQLAKIPDVGKMIKYLECKDDINYELIEDRSGLTLNDISALIITLSREDKFYFYGVEENFGQSEMEHVLNENKKSIGELNGIREEFENAEAKLNEQMLNFELEVHVGCLLGCLKFAAEELKIMHKQLAMIYQKNVIVRGHYRTFSRDWREACIPGHVDVDSTSEEAADFQNFILCVEMLAAAVGHLYAFPYKEYAGANIGAARDLTGSLAHALKFNDFYHDTVHQFAPTYHDYVLYNSTEGDEGAVKYRSRTFVPTGQEMDAVRRNKYGGKLDDIQLSSVSTTPVLSTTSRDPEAMKSSLLKEAASSSARPYDLSLLIDTDMLSYPAKVPAVESTKL